MHLLKKIKDIYTILIDFIEATDDFDAEFDILITIFEKTLILRNYKEIQFSF